MTSTSTIRLQSNGDYWQARWTDDRGRSRGKSLGHKSKVTEQQAIEKCRELERQHILSPARRNMDQAPTIGNWLINFKELTPHYSEGTRALYDRVGNLLTEYFGGTQRIDRIKRIDAGKFRAWLKSSSPDITENTIRKHIRHCKVIFSLAKTYEVVHENTFDHEPSSPPETDKDWHYMTLEELDQVIEQCPNHRWIVLFSLCRLAGLRLGEALRLKWQDTNIEKAMLTVEHAGEHTTKKRRRDVPMTPRLQAIMVRALEAAEPGSTLACGLTRTRLYHQAAGILQRAGIKPYDKLFHTLRKNCESDWFAQGYPTMAVCSWLGHSPSVAARFYHRPEQAVIDRVTGKASPQTTPQNNLV